MYIELYMIWKEAHCVPSDLMSCNFLEETELKIQLGTSETRGCSSTCLTVKLYNRMWMTVQLYSSFTCIARSYRAYVCLSTPFAFNTFEYVATTLHIGGRKRTWTHAVWSLIHVA